MQAIQTKYLGPTNYKPSRVKAWCEAGSLTVSWCHDLGIEENHAAVARALAEKLDWTGGNYGHLVGGCLPSNNGYAFVFTVKPI